MTKLIDIFPFNLALELFRSEEEVMNLFIPGIDKALATLTEREREILLRRYSDQLTLKDCGKIYGITQERIRQIQMKALRRLRHPSRKKLYQSVPMLDFIELRHDYEKLKSEHDFLLKDFGACVPNMGDPEIVENKLKLAIIGGTTLDEVGLTVRAYNCLVRAGKNTIRDLTSMTENDLLRVRNLGKLSANHVIMRLADLGLHLAQKAGD